MDGCTISIELEDERRVFEAGEKIAGTVRVRVEQPCADVRLSLDQRWRTDGRPSRYQGHCDDILLFEGAWSGVGVYRYPFIFNVPPGPYTYHGKLLRVDWFLHAQASCGDEQPSTADEKIAVEASGCERDFIIGDTDANAASAPRLTGAQRTLWAVGSLLTLLIGLWLLYPSVAATEAASWTTLLAGLGCVGLAGFSGRRLLAQSRVEDTGHSGPPSGDFQVEPGDRIGFVVELQPNFQTNPKRVTAVLKGYEHVSFRDEDTHHAEVHRFHEEPATIEPVDDGAPGKGQRRSFRVSCRVPAHAPYSFWCPTAAVCWAVEVHVDVGTWPDWRREFPLVVRPRVGAAPAPRPPDQRSTGRSELSRR